MKYFTLVLAFCMLNSISTQTDWTENIIAKFDFTDLAGPQSSTTLLADEFNSDTQLAIQGYFHGDEQGPADSYNAVGLEDDYMEVLAGSHPVWESTSTFTLSFGFMDYSGNYQMNPVIGITDNNGKWLVLSQTGETVRLEYKPDNYTESLIEGYHLPPSTSVSSSFDWYIFNLVIDTESNEIKFFVDGESAITLSSEMEEWEGIQVRFSHDGYYNMAQNSWFCYSDIYLHSIAFSEEDAQYYKDVVYLMVNNREPILSDSPIEVYPTLLSHQTPLRIVNPANTAFTGQVVDEAGRIIQHFTQQRNSLHLRNVASGLYRLRFVTEEGVVVRTVVVQ